MAKKVTANGKTFTFDDNVTEEQISTAIDDYFAGETQPVKKKVESGTSVPSPYPMGRGPLASPIQISQREEIETPTWQQQKEVERKRAGASVPAKPVKPQREELGAGESVVNTLINTWTAAKGMPARGVMAIESLREQANKKFMQAYGRLSGYDPDLTDMVADQLASRIPKDITGVTPIQAKAEAAKKIKKLEEEMLPTKGIIETASNGDVLGLLAGTFDAGMAVASTAVTAVPTAGLSIWTDMIGQSLYDYNSEKAKEKGITIEELYENNEDDFAIPFTIGALAGSLEKIGLEGVSKAIVKKLRPMSAKKGFDFFFEINKEGGTEWLQFGLEKINEASAKGETDPEKLAEVFIDNVFSKDGAETYLKGLVGSGVAVGTGRAIKAAYKTLRPSSQEELKDDMAKAESLAADIKNPNIPPDVRTALADEIQSLTEKMVKRATEDLAIKDNLNETEITEISSYDDELKKKLEELSVMQGVLDNPDVTDETKAIYEEKLKEKQVAINDINSKIDAVYDKGKQRQAAKKVVLQKYTGATADRFGYIDRGDGKGKVELTEEEFLAEQSGLTRLIREQRDIEIQELEKIRPDLTDQDLLLTDLPASVDKTLDRVYEGTPTDPVQIQEAIDALDKKFDELEAYKKDPKRTHTTEVIDSLIDVLSEAKSTLQRYENEVRPTESRAEEGAGKPEVPSAKGITPEQKAAGGEVTTPSVPAIEAAEDISKEDENYRQSREVTEAVSKENPDASVLITPRGNDLNLAAVYVGKEKRGKGIGSKVLDSVKRQADRLGKKVVLDATNELDEETDLEKLGKFYERNGFVKVGENKYEYNPPKGGGIAAPSVPAIETKPTQYDKENIQGVSGKERVGQEPEQAKPEQKGGAEAPTAGGILQATQEEIEATAKGRKLKADDYYNMSPIQVMAELSKLPELKQLADEAISLQEEVDRITNIAGGRVEGMPTLFPYRLVVDFITSAQKTKEKQDSAVDKFKSQIEELKQYLKTKPSDAELGKMKQDREVRAKEEAEKIKAKQELSAQKVAAINQIEKKERSFIESINKNDSRTIANLLYSGLTKNTISKLNQVRLAFEQIDGINIPLSKIERIMIKYQYDVNKFIEAVKNKEFDIFSSAKANELIEILSTKEQLLKPTTDETKTETKDGEPMPKGVSGVRPEGEGREKGAELRPEAEEEVDAEREELLMTGEAEERREKGRYTKDGVEYVRQKPDKGIRGNKGEVRFAKGIEVPFTYKLIERKRAQASHRSGLRNPMHFVPETQPKNRTDKESIAAELDFANNPDWLRLGAMPDAYSGAPIVLPTDEGIQGHNRLAGLSLGYSFGNMAYKEMLVENAEQFGFTKEQVMAMEEPILVREVNVSDEYAIELGNYKYADLETGGIGRIDPVSLVRRIPVPRKLQLMDLVITDDTINASIRKNFTEVYNILRRYLNSAQRSGLMKPDGEPTTSAVMEIETLINQFLFDGGDVSLSEIFENLPYNAREGLKRSLRYLLVADKEKSLLPEVQEAIVIMRKFDLSGSESFETFLKQIDAFNPDYPTPSDLYDPVAIEIARRIIPERKITAIPLIFGEYKNLTIGKKKPKKGEQFQAGMSFPTEGETQEEEVILTKAEAIQTLFNIDYEKESKFKRRESAKRGGAEVSEQEVPAEPKEPAEPQKPAGAEVKPSAPAQAPTSVPADLASAISQTSELYSRIYDPETTAKEKREIKNQIKEMLKDYPYLEYIYNNIKDINSQLENLGMLTKEGDCP